MKGDLISRNALIQRIVAERDTVVTDNHYDVGYNNGLSMAYAMAYNAPAVESEPVVHAHWEDEYGGKFANPRYRCSACKEKALYKYERDVLGHYKETQALTPRCFSCGAHMDEGAAE